MRAEPDHGTGAQRPPLSRWLTAQLASRSWVRAMFTQAERLRALHGVDAVADLALGQPLEPPPGVREALAAAAAETMPGRNAYMPNLGYPELRARLAEDVDAAGITGAHIAVTGGAGAAISLALRSLVDPGDTVLGVLPAFGEYGAYAAAAGAHFVGVPSTPSGGIDLDAIAAALDERVAAVVLNSPCNPSGHVIDAAEFAGLAEVLAAHAQRRGTPALLIVDEVYRRLLFAPATRVEPFAFWPATMLARSFSKDLGLAGERIGYLAVHPELHSDELKAALELAQRALGFVNAPATLQRTLLALSSFEVDVAPYVERRDRALTVAAEVGLELTPPQGGIFLWVHAPAGDGLELAQALTARRVVVAPGVAFGARDHVRICLTAPPAAVERCLRLIPHVSAELVAEPSAAGQSRFRGSGQPPRAGGSASAPAASRRSS